MIRLLPVFTLFLFSCDEVHIQPQTGPETTIPEMTAEDTATIINRIYFDFDYQDTLIEDFPNEISDQVQINYQFSGDYVEYYSREEPYMKNCRLKDRNGLSLSKGFKHSEILRYLFSDKLTYLVNDDENDSILVSWWHCSSCLRDSVSYFGYYGYGKEFPDSAINTSFITGDYEFTLKNKNYRLIGFASYPGEFAMMFVGRFSGGIMGYALFEERGENSVLIDMNRNVGIYGTYNHPFEPDIRIANDEFFLIYELSNGGAGGPYTSINDVYYFSENKMQHMLSENFLMLYSTEVGEWKTKYQFYLDSTTRQTGLKFVTTGWFVGYGNGSENEYGDYFQEAPRDFSMAVKDCDITRRPFEFQLERKFIYSKGKTRKTEKFRSKKLSGKWVTERIRKP